MIQALVILHPLPQFTHSSCRVQPMQPLSSNVTVNSSVHCEDISLKIYICTVKAKQNQKWLAAKCRGKKHV